MISLLELYNLKEGPPKGLDYKKSFKKARNALVKTGIPGIAKDIDVPKDPKKPQTAKPIRPGGPDEDPLKTSSNAELFETDNGDYFVYRGINTKYYALYVSADRKHVKDLGEFGGRKEAIDSVLTHHDKEMAGLGHK
jgi:hypothetical protein